MPPTLVITLCSIAWSAGLFIGMFTSRFVLKKDCLKHKAEMWGRIDAIQNCLAGGRIQFELRMVPQGANQNAE